MGCADEPTTEGSGTGSGGSGGTDGTGTGAGKGTIIKIFTQFLYNSPVIN